MESDERASAAGVARVALCGDLQAAGCEPACVMMAATPDECELHVSSGTGRHHTGGQPMLAHALISPRLRTAPHPLSSTLVAIAILAVVVGVLFAVRIDVCVELDLFVVPESHPPATTCLGAGVHAVSTPDLPAVLDPVLANPSSRLAALSYSIGPESNLAGIIVNTSDLRPPANLVDVVGVALMTLPTRTKAQFGWDQFPFVLELSADYTFNGTDSVAAALARAVEDFFAAVQKWSSQQPSRGDVLLSRVPRARGSGGRASRLCEHVLCGCSLSRRQCVDHAPRGHCGVVARRLGRGEPQRTIARRAAAAK